MSPVAQYEQTTASSPRYWFRHESSESEVIASALYKKVAFIDEFLRNIQRRTEDPSLLEEGDVLPNQDTVKCLAKLVVAADIPASSLTSVDVSTFYGELDLTWEKDNKQITLLCGGAGGDVPQIHFYRRVPGLPSEHGLIPNVSTQVFQQWVNWLNAE